MSVIQSITWKSLPIETLNTFDATFNAFGGGVYDFTQVAANQNQVVIPLNERYLYLIERVTFSASIGEGDYLQSINVTPVFRFGFQNTPRGQAVYPKPLPGVRYHDGLEFNFWFNSNKRNDALVVTLEGILDQIPATVGIQTIRAQLSLVVYQEENLQKIGKMRNKTSVSIGNLYDRGI